MTLRQLYLYWLLLMLSLLILGCSSKGNRAELKELRVVTASDPLIRVSTTDPITWYARMSLHIPQVSNETRQMAAYLEQEIAAVVEENGFNFLPHKQDSRFQLVALAMIGENDANKKLLQLFKIFPELSNSSELAPGTLIVALVDSASHQTVWRGSVKVFLQNEMPIKQRQARAKLAIAKLLKSLKPAR